jgi:hypothetical protein
MKVDTAHPTEPIKPGHIKLVRLAHEGRLACGDLIATGKLGVCTVVSIEAVSIIRVQAVDGRRYMLTGIDWDARLSTRSAA